MLGTVVKAKIGDLEEEAREGFYRRMTKELTGVVQGVSGKKRLLVMFQYKLEKDLNLNQLTILVLEKIPVEEEPDVPTITEIPDEKVTLKKGYYHGVYDILHFNKEDGVDKREDKADAEQDHDEEEMEYVELDDERERHWRIVFRTMMEGWAIRRHCYMLRCGMST